MNLNYHNLRGGAEDQKVKDARAHVTTTIAAMDEDEQRPILDWMARLARQGRSSWFYVRLAELQEEHRRDFLRQLAHAGRYDRFVLMSGLKHDALHEKRMEIKNLPGEVKFLLLGFLVPWAVLVGGYGLSSYIVIAAPAVFLLLGSYFLFQFVAGYAGWLTAVFVVAGVLSAVLFLSAKYGSRSHERRRYRERRAAVEIPAHPEVVVQHPVPTQPPRVVTSGGNGANGLVVLVLIIVALAAAIWAVDKLDEIELPRVKAPDGPAVVVRSAERSVAGGLGTSHLPLGVERRNPGGAAIQWNSAACVGSTDGHGCSRENKWGALRKFAPGLSQCSTGTAVYVEPNGRVSAVWTVRSSGNAGCDRAQEYWMSRTVWQATGWIAYDSVIAL